MQDVNTLTICRTHYETEREWLDALVNAVKLLLDAEYIMTIRYDEKGLGIISIEYNYADQSFGSRYPYWLLPEEEEHVHYLEEEPE